MYLERVQQRHLVLQGLGYGKPIPCTGGEVQELEKALGHRLPEAYRAFLFWMGHSGGGFLRGSDCFYEQLRDIQIFAKELLEEDQFGGVLPEEAFVFFMHQGYQFNFFCFNEGEDPPVYVYREEIPVQTTFSRLYPTVSDFLVTEMEGHIQLEEERMK